MRRELYGNGGARWRSTRNTRRHTTAWVMRSMRKGGRRRPWRTGATVSGCNRTTHRRCGGRPGYWRPRPMRQSGTAARRWRSRYGRLNSLAERTRGCWTRSRPREILRDHLPHATQAEAERTTRAHRKVVPGASAQPPDTPAEWSRWVRLPAATGIRFGIPAAFDVIVMPNLYGDILSDVARSEERRVGKECR